MVCSLSDAMGARGARACDYCIRKRARWYCAADDAFLCQTCDSSVHSANPLARRHGRVELKTTTTTTTTTLESIEPSWHPRKARTPRHGKPPTVVVSKNPVHLVPEICSQENSHDDNDEEQLLYRVPIFVPDLCNTNITDANAAVVVNCSSAGHTNWEGKIINNMATEMELAEFAADVESLLGKGLDDEESSFDMEGLGFLGADDINNQSEMECCFGYDEKVMKVEEENNAAAAAAAQVLTMNHMTNFDTLDLKFDYDDSPANNEEEEMSTVDDGSKIIMRKKTILLNLDYEGVILAWSDHRSPWTTGQRPAELNSNHASWPDCMQRGCGTIHPYGVGMRSGIDGGREARVSRYREKRRSRLFSKKIRYEVRKLNAEKRPRMKGRFVKRPNFPSINK